MGSSGLRDPEWTTDSVIEAEETITALLGSLDDTDCREILDATSEALSANEIAEVCNLPLSTTYRKLDLLTDAGLLEERTRVRQSGHHASEYSRIIEDITISLGACGELELEVSHCERSDRLTSSPRRTREERR